MNGVWMALAGIAGILSLVCWVVILIDAFRDEIWKGILFLLCGFYGLYYAIFDFEHDNKWPIVIGAFAGSAIVGGLLGMMR